MAYQSRISAARRHGLSLSRWSLLSLAGESCGKIDNPPGIKSAAQPARRPSRFAYLIGSSMFADNLPSMG